MNAEIRKLYSLEVEDDLVRYQPAGPDWRSIAVRIARFAAWEFEDYQM